MTDMDNWVELNKLKIRGMALKDRETELRLVIAKTTRFINNPFVGGSSTKNINSLAAERKNKYESAIIKRNVAERELKQVEKEIPQLIKQIQRIEKTQKRSKRKTGK